MIWTPPSHNEAPVTVTVPSRAALLDDLQDHLSTGTGFSVATLNLDHVVKLRRDPVFRQAYGAQTHITADGRPIVWLSRYAGQPVDLVTGSDLVEPMLALCAKMSAPVAFLGSSDAVLQRAAQILQARYPGLRIVAKIAPPMGFDPTSDAAEALLSEMAEAGAQVCLLALGAPKQEILAARGGKLYPHTGFLSVGASLDFIAGTQVRAPRWVRAIGAEWAWRLAQNPRRLAARYGACFAILPGLLLRALQARRALGRARVS